ncbi:hypothetical protein BO86DRAFT_153896 [Aspergillus japonicus CBS 114.51]|uniref:Uncharacterized protein n=1 Tax=Aspergillus japonicus CBS 114.51 TaxID=1448312 RepID=A0A8T8WUB6_ASPJA|nr:hypothetical protein BO86DRAFT_153896 [Aspergillus japonicus CBS 114.51]RAH79391.1 hypothetical protein BO86DRAFT_153896 [Aspergillus japonicus CBS 114.51]
MSFLCTKPFSLRLPEFSHLPAGNHPEIKSHFLGLWLHTHRLIGLVHRLAPCGMPPRKLFCLRAGSSFFVWSCVTFCQKLF